MNYTHLGKEFKKQDNCDVSLTLAYWMQETHQLKLLTVVTVTCFTAALIYANASYNWTWLLAVYSFTLCYCIFFASHLHENEHRIVVPMYTQKQNALFLK